MTTVLHDEEGTRIVVLSQCLPDDGDMREMRARLTENFAIFVRLKEDAKSKSFALTVPEADAFVTAWTAYKADQQAKAEAEEQRQAEVITQAYAIAKEYPAIQIEERGEKASWHVTIPGIGWNTGYYTDWAYSADALLRHVHRALETYQQHQAVHQPAQDC